MVKSKTSGLGTVLLKCQNFRISTLLDVRLKKFLFCILLNLVEVCDDMNHCSTLVIYKSKSTWKYVLIHGSLKPKGIIST